LEKKSDTSYNFVIKQWSKVAYSNPKNKKSPKIKALQQKPLNIWKNKNKKERVFGRKKKKEPEEDRTMTLNKGERNEKKQDFLVLLFTQRQ